MAHDTLYAIGEALIDMIPSKTGCTFAEVPFTLYYDSKEGESKMNLGKTIRDSFLTALRLRVRG